METYLNLLPALLKGAGVTLQLALWSTLFGAVLAFASGIGKLSGIAPIRWLSFTYVEIFRGTSLLVQLFWLYFALPVAGQAMGIDLRLPPVVAMLRSCGEAPARIALDSKG